MLPSSQTLLRRRKHEPWNAILTLMSSQILLPQRKHQSRTLSHDLASKRFPWLAGGPPCCRDSLDLCPFRGSWILRAGHRRIFPPLHCVRILLVLVPPLSGISTELAVEDPRS